MTNSELYLKALDGDIEAGVDLFDAYLNKTTEGFYLEVEGIKEVFLKRSSVLKVLNHLKFKNYPDWMVCRWAKSFQECSPDLERDEDTNDVLFRLRELGDSIDGTIESDELEGMIALMSLPDVWDLETAKLYS